mmetsp:Transcript_14580/g.21977  ORF Transcript_14580/g.21977 Transcript_14580/m.21977 type:complete len:351 (+) Transcript_14580:100-1152(+)
MFTFSKFPKLDPVDIALIVDSKDSDVVSALYNLTTSILLMDSIDGLETSRMIRAIIFVADAAREADISWARSSFPKAFVAVYNPSAAYNPNVRLMNFDAGANMVAHDIASLVTTLCKAVLYAGSGGGYYECPYCNFHSLTEDELRSHLPAYHINWPHNRGAVRCPICRETVRKPLQVHIHDDHGPAARRRRGAPMREHSKIRFYGFGLVVCRHPSTGAYLLCQEFANQGFWVPGGAVDAGETFVAAATRETLEEAGINIEVKGILSIDHSPQCDGDDYYAKMRVIFYAEPIDASQVPKSIPDFESAGACWCSYQQIMSGLKLRGSEPKQWASYLENGGQIFPLSLLKERS